MRAAEATVSRAPKLDEDLADQRGLVPARAVAACDTCAGLGAADGDGRRRARRRLLLGHLRRLGGLLRFRRLFLLQGTVEVVELVRCDHAIAGAPAAPRRACRRWPSLELLAGRHRGAALSSPGVSSALALATVAGIAADVAVPAPSRRPSCLGFVGRTPRRIWRSCDAAALALPRTLAGRTCRPLRCRMSRLMCPNWPHAPAADRRDTAKPGQPCRSDQGQALRWL